VYRVATLTVQLRGDCQLLSGVTQFALPNNPVQAGKLMQLQLRRATEAMARLGEDDQWEVSIHLGTELVEPVEASKARFHSWLMNQGATPAMLWVKEMIPLAQEGG